jgi:hypothetical protein
MSKRGPLSKVEKFYIEKNLDLGVDALAEELDRAKSVIKAYSKTIPEPKIAENPTPSSENIFSNKRGSTVMTETGSMLSDDFRSNRTKKDSKRPGCVAPIK